MKYLCITIFVILLLLFILKQFNDNEHFKNCIQYFNKSNLTNNNLCQTYFVKKRPNYVCDKLINLGWNPDWKQSDLIQSNKFTKNLNNKITKEIGTITTNQIKNCFPNYI